MKEGLILIVLCIAGIIYNKVTELINDPIEIEIELNEEDNIL